MTIELVMGSRDTRGNRRTLAPVMNELASLRQSRAAPLYSWGSDRRPSLIKWISIIEGDPLGSDRAYHVLALPLFFQFGLVLEVFQHHRCDDVACRDFSSLGLVLVSSQNRTAVHTWTERIHSDWFPVDHLSPFHCKAASQLTYCSLR